jgi:hypothetical protein
MAAPREPQFDPQSSAPPKAATDGLAKLLGIEDEDRRTYLLEELDKLTSTSGNLQSVGVAGAPSKQLKAARSVESACDSILSVFAIKDREFDLEAAVAASPIASILAFQIAQIVSKDRHHHSPLVDEESRVRVAAILAGVVLLRDAARRAREQAERDKGEGLGGARRVANWPLKEMAWHILRLYIELTNRRPGISKRPGGGRRGGPAVRFLDVTFRWLGWSIKANTAAQLITELKNDPSLMETLDDPIFKSEKS